MGEQDDDMIDDRAALNSILALLVDLRARLEDEPAFVERIEAAYGAMKRWRDELETRTIP